LPICRITIKRYLGHVLARAKRATLWLRVVGEEELFSMEEES